MFGAIAMSNIATLAEDGSAKAEPPPATPVVVPKPTVILRIEEGEGISKVLDKKDSSLIDYLRRTFAVSNVRDLTDDRKPEKEGIRRVLEELGVNATGFLPLEEVLDKKYLPNVGRFEDSHPLSFLWQTRSELDSVLLSNGVRHPGQKQFEELSRELSSDLKDVYHSIRRDHSKEGFKTVSLKNFRKFWMTLNAVGTYWDSSLDTRATTGKPPKNIDVNEPQGSFETMDIDEALTYTGRRTSSGKYMQPALSLDLIQAFLQPIMGAFGCHFTSNPMPDTDSPFNHNLYLVDVIIPIDITSLVYSQPRDRATARRGILQGPIAVVEAHGQYNLNGEYVIDEAEHLLQDLKSLLLCAQQRSREGKRAFVPGTGQDWPWTLRPRWQPSGQPITDLDLLIDGKIRSEKSKTRRTVTSKKQASAASKKGLIASRTAMEDNEADTAATGGPSHEGIKMDNINKSFAEAVENPQRKGLPDVYSNAASFGRQLVGKELETALEKTTLARDFGVNSHILDTAPTATSDSIPAKKRSFGTFSSGLKQQSLDEVQAIDPKVSADILDTISSDTSSDMSDHQAGPPLPHEMNLAERRARQAKENLEFYRVKLRELRLKEEKKKQNESNAKDKKLETDAPKPKEGKQQEGVMKHAEDVEKRSEEIFPVSTMNVSKKIGVHPFETHDEIYLITIVNHHVAFVSTRLHKDFVQWLSPVPAEHAKVAGLKKDPKTWWGIPLKRTRWYNLFDAGDRCEALKGAWAIFSKMMRDVQNDRLATHRGE